MAATTKTSIWDIVGEALSHPRCICGCGRWSEEDRVFATPECFNKEEPEIVH